MRYIWQSGDLRNRRVMHIEMHDVFGDETMKSLCGRGPHGGFNRSINAPFSLGRPVCEFCRRAAP